MVTLIGKLDRCWRFLRPRDEPQPDTLPGWREYERKFTIKLCPCLTRKEFTWLIFLARSQIRALTCA